MTDWTARKIELPLSFLPPGEYTATVVADGMNADHYAADYKIESRAVAPRSSLAIDLAPGGGFVARLTR
jgi:alpha-glucosidase